MKDKICQTYLFGTPRIRNLFEGEQPILCSSKLDHICPRSDQLLHFIRLFVVATSQNLRPHFIEVSFSDSEGKHISVLISALESVFPDAGALLDRLSHDGFQLLLELILDVYIEDAVVCYSGSKRPLNDP